MDDSFQGWMDKIKRSFQTESIVLKLSLASVNVPLLYSENFYKAGFKEKMD